MSEKRKERARSRRRTRAAKVVVERKYRARLEELWDLWTTKEEFESCWAPEGFRVEVFTLEARLGGTLHYDMTAEARLLAKSCHYAPTTPPSAGMSSQNIRSAP
jgi:uncharacterized protein YndB with AHSA1/START domain